MSNILILGIGHSFVPVNTTISKSNVNGQIFVTTKMDQGIVVDKVYPADKGDWAVEQGKQLHTFWCVVAENIFNMGYHTGLNEGK